MNHLNQENEENKNPSESKLTNLEEEGTITNKGKGNIGGQNLASIIGEDEKFSDVESLKDAIENEKRTRHYFSESLNYMLSLRGDFDFYSDDAIALLKTTKDLSLYFKQKTATSDLLLLAFFCKESSRLPILKTYFSDFDSALTAYEKFRMRQKSKRMRKKLRALNNSISQQPVKIVPKIIQIFKQEKSIVKSIELINFVFSRESHSYNKALLRLKKIYSRSQVLVGKIKDYWMKLDNAIDFILEELKLVKKKKVKAFSLKPSKELTTILNATIKEAIERFQTPLVTTDLLLLVLSEKMLEDHLEIISNPTYDPKVRAFFWWREIFPQYSLTQLYVLRYKILRQVHQYQVKVKEQIKPDQQFFAYLLQTQIPETQIRELIDKNNLEPSVTFFRDELVKKVFESDLHDILLEQILKNSSPQRKYSET